MGLVRACQWLGAVLVTVSAFFPTLEIVAWPARAEPVSSGAHRTAAHVPRAVPARELTTAVQGSLRGPDRVGPLWNVRRWYPWYLAPLWLLALLVTPGPGVARRVLARRVVGALLVLLTAGLIALEAAYLKAEYAPFLSGGLGRAETVLAWGIVVGLLLYRRRADRHLGAIEACLASQALLGLVHGITLPATMLRRWLPGHEADVALEAVGRNFTAGFWWGMAGLLLVALPVYVRRTGVLVSGTRRVDS